MVTNEFFTKTLKQQRESFNDDKSDGTGLSNLANSNQGISAFGCI